MNRITIKEVAKEMKKSEQFIRIGLQRGILPIGCAIKNNGRYCYYISPKLLYEFSGIRIGNIGEEGNYEKEKKN